MSQSCTTTRNDTFFHSGFGSVDRIFQAQLAVFRFLLVEVEIIGDLVIRHIGNRLPIEGHHLFRLALGRKKAAETNHTQGQDNSSPLLPGRRVLFRRHSMLFPVPPAIFLHPFFPCSFFVSHILTYLYLIFQSPLAPLIGELSV